MSNSLQKALLLQPLSRSFFSHNKSIHQSLNSIHSRFFRSLPKFSHNAAQPAQSIPNNNKTTNNTKAATTATLNSPTSESEAPHIDPHLLTPPKSSSKLNGLKLPTHNNNRKSSVRFSIEDSAGALQEALKWFWKHNINMTRLESRPNKKTSDYDFFVDFIGDVHEETVQNLLQDLRNHTKDVTLLESRRVPWFPKRVRELDRIANQILDAGAELQADHPGFTDPVYRARRRELAQVALDYTHNSPIPRINYTPQEIATWSVIYDKLMPLLEKHACSEHVRLLPLLVENCGYRRDNIPQAQDISDFLKECTGFTLRPVAGLLSARNFLYGLAFRVFFSTQYLRHSSKPLYTPEPDLVHELMGHAPLFADQAFADFSQEIGLAALGATDDQITQLARCYWFSVEFGLCLQNGERKAYGAGLLSSFGELEYSMSDKPEVRPFDPFQAGKQDYPITTYQPIYYAAQSFEDAKIKIQNFSNSFSRPFNVRYNPYSQSIEVDGNVTVDEESLKKK